MSVQELDARLSKARVEARDICDDAWKRAYESYKKVKEQADIVYQEAKKIAVDKEAKKELERTHKEAIEQAKKIRDAITAEAMVVFTAAWEQSEREYNGAIAKSKEISVRAQKAYEEAKKQADIVYQEAKKMAVDKEAKKEVEKAHKETLEQAKKDYENAITESH